MDTISLIFKKTRYFWSLSRIVFMILFFKVILDEFQKNTDSLAKIAPYLLFSTLFLGMIFIQIMGLLKSKKLLKLHQCIKIYVSGFMIFFGFFMFYLLFFQTKSTIGFIFLPIWIFLFGVYEFSTIVKKEIDYKSEINEIGIETQI